MTATGWGPPLIPAPDGSLAARQTPDGRWIVLRRMAYDNLRVCLTYTDDLYSGYRRGWCYPAGATGAAMVALVDWTGEGDPPVGWVKEVGTERRRPGGNPEWEYHADRADEMTRELARRAADSGDPDMIERAKLGDFT